ncbi:hypothetical protein CVT24_001819 [Panaeolus cyanescens]|uniref:F-box domain-containing protein n=1 Tax=Panaeolus cyanescens TaxID=181874 RepID=A0A409YFG5_9AGAR|nr:hypothetical protein CVT24_001819 [Panaeolus cyanescens]
MPCKGPIPYDIYLEVFSHISNDDKATISACSQLAPCFLEPMQKRLFKSIDLEYRERSVEDSRGLYDGFIVWADEMEESKSKMLLRALESNPKLATYIEELKLTINDIPGYNMVSTLENKAITANGLFSYLSSLASLSVISDSSTEYEAYSKPLQSAIRQLLGRNTKLTNVNLSGIRDFVITELQHLPSSVKSLTLGHISTLRPLLPGENPSSPGDQDGLACAPTSLCITNPRALDTFLGALHGEVEITDSYRVHRYKRCTPYLSFALLESLKISEISCVYRFRELLSFADPHKLQHLQFKAPFDSHITHSIIFRDHEAPTFTLERRLGAGPFNLNRVRLDLSDLSGLKSFQTHGKMTFIQENNLNGSPTTISTHIPWLTQMIEKLPRPDNDGLSSLDNNQGPSLRSVRVLLDVTLIVIDDNNKSQEAFASFNFSPLINAMKKLQRQYSRLHDAVCSLDFEVTVCQDDVPSEYPHYNVGKEDFLETLKSNPTLQDDFDDNKVMLQVLDVRRAPYPSVPV